MITDPARLPRIVVLLPCYNEEAAIRRTVAAFRAALPQAAIYVYDNNSTDRTATAKCNLRRRLQQERRLADARIAAHQYC